MIYAYTNYKLEIFTTYAIFLLCFAKFVILNLCATFQSRFDIYCICQLSRITTKIINILKLDSIVYWTYTKNVWIYVFAIFDIKIFEVLSLYFVCFVVLLDFQKRKSNLNNFNVNCYKRELNLLYTSGKRKTGFWWSGQAPIRGACDSENWLWSAPGRTVGLKLFGAPRVYKQGSLGCSQECSILNWVA